MTRKGEREGVRKRGRVRGREGGPLVSGWGNEQCSRPSAWALSGATIGGKSQNKLEKRPV